jgi:NAD(P)-dependent dehydrogenase (short-subunit alcohol dehydrogenase family)
MKTVFITGAGSGIGVGLAHAFAEEGNRLILGDIDYERVTGVKDKLVKKGHTVIAVELDISEPESWKEARDLTQEEYGDIDILCNNAGVAGALQVGIEDVSLAKWLWTINVNLVGAFYGVKTFVSEMKRRGSGHIVNTGSLASIIAYPKSSDYSTSKHGIAGLSRSLRQELEPFGIGVTLLCPSFVDTGLINNSAQLSPEGRSGNSDELAAIADNLSKGMAPVDVGYLVLAGIEANREHLFTDPQGRDDLEAPGKRVSKDIEWCQQYLKNR